MAQEDDLRALGKIMDFMRGISVLFLLINCYWFCYSAFETWHFTLAIIDKILLNFQRTTGLFSSILWTKLFCVVFLGLSCLGTKGRQGRKYNVGNDLFSPCCGLCPLLSQLVVACFAHIGSRCSITLHLLVVPRLYLPIDGWSVDESFAQKQSDG